MRPETISRSKEKYLSELGEYCNYELNLTPKGNFKNVVIKEVWCDTYYKTYKKDFIKWLDEEDVFALVGKGNSTTLDDIVNYYCSQNNIPYLGNHWLKRKGENTRHANPDFPIWNYLYNISKKIIANKRKDKPYIRGDKDYSSIKRIIIKEEDNFNGRCIYGIYLRDELVYIGQTIHFKQRSHEHLQGIVRGRGPILYQELTKEDIENISIKPILKVDEELVSNVTDRDLNAMEIALILEHKPRLNTIGINSIYNIGNNAAGADV